MSIKPYQNLEKGKKQQIALMFDNISKKYDFLNHFLSLGIDRLWRKKVVHLLSKTRAKQILDIATGTGDLAFAISKLPVEKITGVDISKGMLDIAKQKVKTKKLEHLVEFEIGDSENLRFENNTFDAITVAFGVRNFENLQAGLQEMYRVLKPKGTLIILEFSKPKNFFVKKTYNLYFFKILPFFGKKISKDANAYTYLPESVKAFPCGDDFIKILKKIGFKAKKNINLSFGISAIYLLEK